jgi:hypothetical protein
MRGYVGIDLGHGPVPDETPECKFRNPLEEHRLGQQIFVRVNEYLAGHGLTVGT